MCASPEGAFWQTPPDMTKTTAERAAELCEA
jgi:hypothetical protein